MRNIFYTYISSCLSFNSWANNPEFPYKNPRLSVEQRVEDLLGRMTLDEKVEQLNTLVFLITLT